MAQPLSLWKRSILILALVGLAGCGKVETSAPEAAGPSAAAPAAPTPTPAPKSATPNSFDEVTAQLDPGGDFYLYLSTQQWLGNLTGFIDGIHQMALSETGTEGADSQQIDKGFVVLKDMVQKSGLEDISGLGISSFAVTADLHRNKFFLHHYAERGTGLLWTICAKEPHPFTQLDFLTADTAVAGFSDFDLAKFINFLRDEANRSGIPEAKDAVTQAQTQFAGVTGLQLDDVLNSLDGSLGMVVTLDASNTVSIPVGPTTQTMPAPRIALFIAVKNDLIFKQVDKMAGGNPGVIKVDQPDLKMRTMALPLIPGLNLRPTVAQWNGYLVVASDDQLINDMIAVKKGGAGLKGVAEFTALSANLPTQGNAFSFTSQRFAETMHKIQSQMLVNQPNASAIQVATMQKWFSMYQKMFAGYGVGTKLPTGWLSVSQGRFVH